MADHKPEGFRIVAAALREFGYPDVTTDDVQTAHGRWVKNETNNRNVIDMMCAGEFEKHPEIFGEQETTDGNEE